MPATGLTVRYLAAAVLTLSGFRMDIALVILLLCLWGGYLRERKGADRGKGVRELTEVSKTMVMALDS